MIRQVRMICFIFIIFLNVINVTYADSSSTCQGENAFINIVNRPSNTNSPCVVPFKQVALELGYAYQRRAQSMGNAHNFPQSELRIGLPFQSEIYLILPNYNDLTVSHLSGFTDSTIGFKHQLASHDKWIVTVEGTLSLPGGSRNFGNKALGGLINAIINYDITSKLSLTLMMGGSNETDPVSSGGRRYSSFNPDGVLSYTLTKRLMIYAEVFGQTKTSAKEQSGFNADAGFLYLLRPTIVVDMSAGQRLSGYLEGYEHYVGAGISFLI